MPKPTRLHHVAFATRDAEATYEFYAKKLGMALVHTENHLSDDGWFRHFFFDMGNGECLGFFAFEGVGEKDGYRTDISTGVGLPVWVNHVAFNVDGMDALEAKRKEVEGNGVELLMEADHGWCHSIYMLDPNGIMVEFTTTTKPKEFGQSEAEALALLRQRPEEFGDEARKDQTTTVSLNRAVMSKIKIAKPAT